MILTWLLKKLKKYYKLKSMRRLLEKNNFLKPPTIGQIVKGKVLGKGKGTLFLDLGPIGTGIIYGREFLAAKEKLKDLKPGDEVLAKIVDLENEEGYIELSVSEASRELTFEILKEKKEKGEVLKIKILGANKGGLLAEVLGVPAFLPVSQLTPEHYPKVENGDKTKILKELQKFIGKELEVQILNFFPENQQLILTEKSKKKTQIKPGIENLKLGQVVEGEISGVTSFGAFIKFGEMEGLIPIWEYGSINPKNGEKVQAKIIEIKEDKIYLSLKT